MLCCVSRADPGWDWYRALKLLCKEMVGVLLGMLLPCRAGSGVELGQVMQEPSMDLCVLSLCCWHGWKRWHCAQLWVSCHSPLHKTVLPKP